MCAQHTDPAYQPPHDDDEFAGQPRPPGPAEVDETLAEPILFNCWKHHARELRRRILDHAQRGEPGLASLRERLVLIGTRISDFYVGNLWPEEICAELTSQLQVAGTLAAEPFKQWVEQQSGFAMAELTDGSRWCLRGGTVPGRHVHIHPGRYSPKTIRVRASLLKTAVATVALAEFEGRDPLSLNVVNDARQRILHLGPVQALPPGVGLGVVLRAMLELPG